MEGWDMRNVLALFVGLSLLTSVVVAQPGPAPEKAGRGERHERFDGLKGLKLTDAQKADFQKMHVELEKSLVRTEADIRLARIDLKGLLTAEKLDRGAIEGKLKEINDLRLASRTAVLDHLFKCNSLLTPEQQKTFRRHMIERLSEERGWVGALRRHFGHPKMGARPEPGGETHGDMPGDMQAK